MIIDKKIRGLKSITRQGEVSTINIPQGADKKLVSNDIVISKKKKDLTFVDGDSIFLIEDEIGVREELQMTVFLAEPYMIVELQWGTVYYKDDKDKICSINETGYTVKNVKNTENIKWVTYKDIIHYVGIMVGLKYNLKIQKEIQTYINNLAFTVIMANDKTKTVSDEPKEQEKEEISYLFRLKVLEYYSDLGLDNFNYEVKEAGVKKQRIDYETKDDWRLEKQRSRAMYQKELQEELEYARIRDGEDLLSYVDEDDFDIAVDSYIEDDELEEGIEDSDYIDEI